MSKNNPVTYANIATFPQRGYMTLCILRTDGKYRDYSVCPWWTDKAPALRVQRIAFAVGEIGKMAVEQVQALQSRWRWPR